ncbi:unnamed protein product [Spirodela intermedia]|uniref:Uncharacterized protein n=1 Tax=Spirodela intermedia TaxID=51605 RepID=A0A7I8IPB1_SPIIN|nr:unnamed protein product [Spirodela intermedia]CAA6658840.1 unnamed protein product [Spirodela intermedia]
MGSIPTAAEKKPHAVCVPYPLAKLLHSRGFHITFVNNEYNHRRLLRSQSLFSLDGIPDFKFRTIPDGLPLIAELMGGEKGKEMRRRAREWKERAVDATKPGGTSSRNLDELVTKLSTAAFSLAGS